MKTKIVTLITCSLAFILSCEKDGNLISVSWRLDSPGIDVE